MIIFTIGHSTRTFDELIRVLTAHEVRALVDVRSYPRSQRHPHFNREHLASCLPGYGITYVHLKDLGGKRCPGIEPSPNGAWHDPGLRAYADYMRTPAFKSGLAALERIAAEHGPAVIMCAEADWRQCHRQLIGDALIVRGIQVEHIWSAEWAEAARLNRFATQREGELVYPAPQGHLLE